MGWINIIYKLMQIGPWRRNLYKILRPPYIDCPFVAWEADFQPCQGDKMTREVMALAQSLHPCKGLGWAAWNVVTKSPLPSWIIYTQLSLPYLQCVWKSVPVSIKQISKWVFPKIMVPQIIHFNRVFHYKPSILGVPLFLETSKSDKGWNWWKPKTVSSSVTFNFPSLTAGCRLHWVGEEHPKPPYLVALRVRDQCNDSKCHVKSFQFNKFNGQTY